MLDPFAVIPVAKPRRVPIKCSTCANQSCTVRGTVVNWLHCSKLPIFICVGDTIRLQRLNLPCNFNTLLVHFDCINQRVDNH